MDPVIVGTASGDVLVLRDVYEALVRRRRLPRAVLGPEVPKLRLVRFRASAMRRP